MFEAVCAGVSVLVRVNVGVSSTGVAVFVNDGVTVIVRVNVPVAEISGVFVRVLVAGITGMDVLV